MKITLNPLFEKLIEQKVSDGLYNTPSEVIQDALRIFFQRENAHKHKLDALNFEIEKGLNNFYKNMLNDSDTILDMVEKYE